LLKFKVGAYWKGGAHLGTTLEDVRVLSLIPQGEERKVHFRETKCLGKLRFQVGRRTIRSLQRRGLVGFPEGSVRR